ncbi:MAG TPA: glycosyltransferase family 2 protein [Elusimicrobiales bacterium]|nr:glycosyltransferase family 2 protein [Elusimicrobiales bacterium]
MTGLTLALIALNEEKDLPSCLDSVQGLAAEIALIDSGSSDGTVAIASARGAKIAKRVFTNYAEQKNAALALAGNDWVLHLDPDEQLTPELKAEITQLLSATPDCDAYEIPYINYFLGQRMRHSGLDGEKHIRLFKKSACSFSGGLLHEGITVNGKVGCLRNAIIHHSYPDLEEYFHKFNRYTSLAAEKMHQSGKPFNVLCLLSAPYAFFRRYVLNAGFLDGVPGLAWATLAAFYVMVKYFKLWRLERNATC